MSIPSRPRRSRIAHFKTPFLLSVAAPAALGMACGGTASDPAQTTSLAEGDAGRESPLACDGEPPVSTGPCGSRGSGSRCVNGEWEATVVVVCNPPPPPTTICPASAAEVGTSCAGYLGGLTCDYEYCYGSEPMRRCSESTGLWEDIPLPSCNPPPPEPDVCQPTLPVPGSDCATAEQVCLYPGGCGEPSSAVCRSGQWLVVYSSGPACNPPGVVPVCPERELVAGEGCAYEGQACSREACELGGESRPGHVCASGLWQEAAVSCTLDGDVPDGGT